MLQDEIICLLSLGVFSCSAQLHTNYPKKGTATDLDTLNAPSEFGHGVNNVTTIMETGEDAITHICQQ